MESSGLWAAPLLLIPGVGLLVLSTSARFGQLHQELNRQLAENNERSVRVLCRRARLLHSALLSQYVAIAVLAVSSLLGTAMNHFYESLAWIPQAMMVLGVTIISFAAIQLIRETRLLITVIIDDSSAN